MNPRAHKQVLVLGTAARGGIRSVIEAYEEAGFYSRGRARFVAAHREAGMVGRLLTALSAYVTVALGLLMGRVALLHLHMSMRGSFWRKAIFLLVGRMAGVPVVIHLHGSEFAVFYNGSKPWMQRMIRGVFDRASAVVVLSESWRAFVGGLTATPVTVIGNFVPDRFDPARAARERNAHAVLFMGQFGERKGIYDLIPAFAEVRRKIPDAMLYCGGNGEVDRVRALVSELGLDDAIKVPGWVSGDEKLALLHGCSVFALPSYNEGLPMAIIEAMSFSMAVVSTAVGGIPELVDGDTGVLVAPGDRAALSSALLEVLADNRAAALGAESRRRYASGFSPQAGMARMRELYLSLGVEP
jgi:glycosyltransferase involved in cell wall biosynthesis